MDLKQKITYNHIIQNKFNAFENVQKIFIGKRKCTNYEKNINNQLSTFKAFGFNSSLKMQFLHSHVKIFPDNVAAVTDLNVKKIH